MGVVITKLDNNYLLDLDLKMTKYGWLFSIFIGIFYHQICKLTIYLLDTVSLGKFTKFHHQIEIIFLFWETIERVSVFCLAKILWKLALWCGILLILKFLFIRRHSITYNLDNVTITNRKNMSMWFFCRKSGGKLVIPRLKLYISRPFGQKGRVWPPPPGYGFGQAETPLMLW